MTNKKNVSQVKSKERITNYGEVFTFEREVNAMLDLVKQETERIDSKFLEPACGDGNFLSEILRRKLVIVEKKYSKNQIEFERYSINVFSSIYGIEILKDNVEICRERLFKIFDEKYTKIFHQKCKIECKRSVKYILSKNIIWGDALDFTNSETKDPIVFSEWISINRVLIKRRDFVYRFLVEETYQFSLFNDEGEPALIDEPVKDYPVVHFLKLGVEDEN